MLYKTTIIPIEQWDKNLKVLFLGDNFGHTDIYLVNKKTNKKLAYTNVSSTAKEDKWLPYSVVTLTNIDAGRYHVYSKDQKTGEESEGFDLYMFGDSKLQNIQKSISVAQCEKSPVVSELCKKIKDDTDCILLIYNKYIKEKNEELKYAYASVLMEYINIQNRQRQNCLLTNTSFKIDAYTQEFKVDPEIEKVFQYDVFNNRINQVCPNNDTNTYSMQMHDDLIYTYIEIGNDYVPVNLTLTFKPERKIYERIRQERIDQRDKYERATEKSVNLPSYLYLNSEREAEYVMLINELQPDIPIILAPHVEFDHGTIIADFEDEYAKFIDIMIGDLFLSFREPDLCLDKNDSRRVPIKNTHVEFDYEQLNMIRQDDYLYWVEDINGKIISDVKVMLLQPVSIYDDEATQDNRDEFVDKLRRINLYQYDQHLKPYIAARYPAIEDTIMDAHKSCEIDTYCDSPTLYHKILSALCVPAYYGQYSTIVRCLFEDRTVYGDYLIDFFKAPLRYKYKENTIVMPAMNDTVFVYERYRFGDSRKIDYLDASPTMATEYRFKDCDFGIVYAINKTTFKRSGFLIVDYCHEGLHASLTRFLLDTMEVVD